MTHCTRPTRQLSTRGLESLQAVGWAERRREAEHVSRPRLASSGEVELNAAWWQAFGYLRLMVEGEGEDEVEVECECEGVKEGER